MKKIYPVAYLFVPLDAVQHQTREAFHRLWTALDNHNVVLLPEDGAPGQLELLGVDVHLVLSKRWKGGENEYIDKMCERQTGRDIDKM